MVITREEWTPDNIWIEYHLTSTGWVRGTERTEKGRYENETEPPFDRVLTIRTFDFMPPVGAPKKWSEIRWVAKNLQIVEETQDDWGALPSFAPAITTENARNFPQLSRFLSAMQTGQGRRPKGSRVRPRRP